MGLKRAGRSTSRSSWRPCRLRGSWSGLMMDGDGHRGSTAHAVQGPGPSLSTRPHASAPQHGIFSISPTQRPSFLHKSPNIHATMLFSKLTRQKKTSSQRVTSGSTASQATRARANGAATPLTHLQFSWAPCNPPPLALRLPLAAKLD